MDERATEVEGIKAGRQAPQQHDGLFNLILCLICVGRRTEDFGGASIDLDL